MMKMRCHCAGPVNNAIALTMAPPMGKPAKATATLAARRSSVLASGTMVMTIGNAPPRPRPVKKRAQVSVRISQAKAVSNEKRPKETTE